MMNIVYLKVKMHLRYVKASFGYIIHKIITLTISIKPIATIAYP